VADYLKVPSDESAILTVNNWEIDMVITDPITAVIATATKISARVKPF